MQAKAILKDTFHFISQKWLQLFMLILPIGLFWHAGSYWIGLELKDTQAMFAELLLSTIMFALVETIVITYAHGLSTGNNLRPTAIYFSALRYWLPMIQLALVKVIVVGLGLMMLIIPGVVIAVRLSLAEQHLVLRNASLIESLRSSATLTAPHFVLLLTVFGYLFLLHLTYEYATTLAPDFLSILLFPLGVLVASFSTLAAYRLYALSHAETPPI